MWTVECRDPKTLALNSAIWVDGLATTLYWVEEYTNYGYAVVVRPGKVTSYSDLAFIGRELLDSEAS